MQVCKYILDSGLVVVQNMLYLNALSLTCPNNSRLVKELRLETKYVLCIRSITTFSGIRALKEAGVITTGSFTSVHDKMILLQYQLLKTNTFVDEVSLKAELFAKGDRNRKDFMMQRQLVGFYLMQDLPDWERRLPIEVYGRLAVLLQSGTFTKEEDKAIMQWVDMYGLTKWNALARTLGRSYAQAGLAAKTR